MNCIDCKDFTCQHRSESTGGGRCYYESVEQKEKLLTMAAEASLHYVDWASFRREAAKCAMCQLIGMRIDNDGCKYKYSAHEVARQAIIYADELIKQLKGHETTIL